MAPLPLWLALGCAVGAFVLAVFGVRALLAMRGAIRRAELDALLMPVHWQAARAFCGLGAGIITFAAVSSLHPAAWVPALFCAGLAYAVAPLFLAEARRRVQQEVLNDLPIHVELMALATEAGSSLPAALALCVEHAPDGALRRAWPRVLREIYSGDAPLEALKSLEQRLDIPAFGSLVATLRNAERTGAQIAPLLRERALHFAAQRFARAERLARAAPLKLWATLMLCIAPCTFLVLAFPLASLLARMVD